MRTLRMTIAYDGSHYCGWQVQPNGLAVQAVLEESLRKFTGETRHIAAAGRTDAGVHAIGQVVSFQTEWTIPCHNFRKALQTYLPDNIVIREVADVPDGFHAQYHAVDKHYRYVIHNSPVQDPFLSHYALWYRLRLDESAMNAACGALLGQQDFRCFETQWPNRASSVRTIYSASVTRQSGWTVWNPEAAGYPQTIRHGGSLARTIETPHPRSEAGHPDWRGDYLQFDICGDGFLYNMVRTIVGSLIHIGRGKWPRERMAEIIAGQSRSDAGETAPARGLYLMNVTYDMTQNFERRARPVVAPPEE